MLYEDVSASLTFARGLKEQGIADVRQHLIDNPDALMSCFSGIKVLRVNQQCLDLCGVESMEVLMEHGPTLWGQETVVPMAEVVTAFADDGAVAHSVEFPITRVADGDQRWILNRVRRVGDSDCVLVTMIDLTEQHQAEEARQIAEQELRHAQQLQVVGQLAGGVAHDFNNILGGIVAGGEVNPQSLELSDSDRVLCDKLIRTAERGSALTARLLGLARRSGAHSWAHVQVVGVVEDAAALLERSLPPDVTVELACHCPADTWLYGASGLLQSAVLNMGLNARDAMAGLVES